MNKKTDEKLVAKALTKLTYEQISTLKIQKEQTIYEALAEDQSLELSTIKKRLINLQIDLGKLEKLLVQQHNELKASRHTFWLIFVGTLIGGLATLFGYTFV